MIKELPQITEQDKIKYQDWWNGLTENWKKAFNQAGFQKGEITDDLSMDEIHDLWHSSALRFAGPTAMFPNLTFEIGDLEGMKLFENLTTLVAINSGIKSLKPIAKLRNLQSLFVLDNELKTLTGIENMVNLTQIYFQNNQITSIEPLRKLINLVDVFAFDNKITALKGLTEKHSRNLTNFRILPNADLPQKEIIKLENRVGIRCLRG
jgi:hypothetical protein